MPRIANIVALACLTAAASSSLAQPLEITDILNLGKDKANHQVRMTATLFDGTTRVSEKYADADGDVTFEKPKVAYSKIAYQDLTAGTPITFKSSLDDDLGSHLFPDMRMPLFDFEDQDLCTIFDFPTYVGTTNSLLGSSFLVANGNVIGLPGVRVLDDGAPFSGTANVFGEDVVALVPAPSAIGILGLAAAATLRRRRR